MNEFLSSGSFFPLRILSLPPSPTFVCPGEIRVGWWMGVSASFGSQKGSGGDFFYFFLKGLTLHAAPSNVSLTLGFGLRNCSWPAPGVQLEPRSVTYLANTLPFDLYRSGDVNFAAFLHFAFKIVHF